MRPREWLNIPRVFCIISEDKKIFRDISHGISFHTDYLIFSCSVKSSHFSRIRNIDFLFLHYDQAKVLQFPADTGRRFSGNPQKIRQKRHRQIHIDLNSLLGRDAKIPCQLPEFGGKFSPDKYCQQYFSADVPAARVSVPDTGTDSSPRRSPVPSAASFCLF